MQVVAGECFQVALGQLELIGKAVCSHRRPMRGNCLSTMVHEMGPCEWLQVNVFRLLWANSSLSARAVCLHHGPVQVVAGEYFQVALGQLELIGKGSVFASRPMRA